jgi:histidyl-tRNA synthetase
MYAFQDKSNREICLIPEATAIVQQAYKTNWQKCKPKPVRVFYVQRCYRYEKPQAGRYREFWQFGVELLGNKAGDKAEVLSILQKLLDISTVNYQLFSSVKRGLDYYIEDGFEAKVESLGAQKQVAGGGRYDCGIGFAIGIDRIMLARGIE